MSRVAFRRFAVIAMAVTLLSMGYAVGPEAPPTAARAVSVVAAPAQDPPAAPEVAASMPGVRAVDEGQSFSCAIRADQSIGCWGQAAGGLTAPPSGTFTAMGLGMYYGCALRDDQSIACWGYSDHGLTSPPPGSFTAIAAGGFFTCALDGDGAITCWGDANAGATTPPAGEFVAIEAGLGHACALTEAGAIDCWGSNDFGQAADPPGTYLSVSAGGFHSCARKADSTIHCWGRDDQDQASPPTGAFAAVSAGWTHSCGIASNGSLDCWGDASYGKSTPPSGTFLAVSAGHGNHTCGIRASGWVACWGDWIYGQSTLPVGLVPQVSAGWYHSCRLLPDNTVACWGDGEGGATTVPAGSYRMVSAGQDFTCAVRTSGTLRCWGDSRYGLTDPPSGYYTTVSAGGNHACAIRTDGFLACWGYDAYGQASPPYEMAVEVSAGFRHSCAVLVSLSVECWGSDSDGQATPPESYWYTSITAGGWHSCAIENGMNWIHCWGYDEYGQTSSPDGGHGMVSAGFGHSCALGGGGQVVCFGDDSDGQSSPPDGAFVNVSSGAGHSCAVDVDGMPTCWGWNYYNQATTAPPAATTYVPIEPTRLLDSRTGNGLSGAFKGNVARTFQIAGRGGIPADAVAITANLTVTKQTKSGYAALTPVATNSPSTSTLNFPVGDTRANNVTAILGPDGKIALVYKASTGQTAHFILDVTGYFVAADSGATYSAVAPVRLLDSRSGNGLTGAFQANAPRTWQISGRESIPAAAIAVTGNLTVTGQSRAGYVSLGPVATATPTTSTLNFPAGDTRANGITVKLSPTGKLSAVYKAVAGSRTHLVFDVTGYYLADLSGARFYPLRPDRLLDSRVDVGLNGAFKAGTARTLVAAPRVGVPEDAVAITGNVTVVGQTRGGYVSMTKATTNSPATSTLNFPVGDVRANGVTGPLTATGKVGLVYKAGTGATTHIVLDVTGYFR